MSRLNFEIYLCWHANKVSIACDSSALPSKWPGAAFASTWGPQDFFDKYVWQSHFHLEKWFGQLSPLVHFSLLLTHDCANVQIVSGIDLCWCVLICVKTAKGFPNQSDLQVSKLALRFLSYWSWSEIPDLLYLIDMGHCFCTIQALLMASNDMWLHVLVLCLKVAGGNVQALLRFLLNYFVCEVNVINCVIWSQLAPGKSGQ